MNLVSTLSAFFTLTVQTFIFPQVVVGGSASGWGPLEDDFSSIDGRSWLLHPGGTRMPVCGSEGPAFAFIEKSNTRYAVTTDISLGQDAFIQFDFSASCSVTNSCYCKHPWFIVLMIKCYKKKREKWNFPQAKVIFLKSSRPLFWKEFRFHSCDFKRVVLAVTWVDKTLTVVFLLFLCSRRVGVFSGSGSDLAASGQRLSAYKPWLLFIYPAEASGFWHF